MFCQKQRHSEVRVNQDLELNNQHDNSGVGAKKVKVNLKSTQLMVARQVLLQKHKTSMASKSTFRRCWGFIILVLDQHGFGSPKLRNQPWQ